MNMARTLSSLVLVCSTVGFAACDIPSDDRTDDADDEAGELGTAQQRFTGTAVLIATVTGGTGFSQTGVGPNTQAFLSGVFGNLGNGGYAWAHIDTPNSLFKMEIGAAPGNTIKAYGWALYPATNSTFNACNHSGAGSVTATLPKPPGATNWRCFISEIQDNAGNYWGSWDDQVLISYAGSSASLKCSGNSGAYAHCIPITHLVVDGAVGGWSGGSTSTHLTPQDPAHGTVCLLRGVWGIFRSGSTNGVAASYSGSGDWYLNTSINKGAYADCAY